jgi:ribosome assembly protein YihI (activator of Der GTPase)
MQKNNQLWEYLKNLSKDEVIDYYENQQYVKEKLKR